MAITLGALVLPPSLVWADEYAWSPIAQSATEYTLTGALVLEEAIKRAGRPITLKGQSDGGSVTVWIARGQSYRGIASLEALRAALLAPEAAFTLTLHDGRQFRVAPRQDGDGPLKVAPRPVFRSFAPAVPGPETFYFMDEIRLMEIPV